MAFEDWLDEQNASWAATSEKPPTMISKLVVLSSFRGPDVGEQARRVWYSLSRAVHHHAYELQPSLTEVRHLVAQTRSLTEANSVAAMV
ncbi:hypothetical protein [Mycobacterium parascrofulaceum]|nr:MULTISPECIES: hypothetical protein [Mycobacterium]